jgi:ABC-type antimicrobial peptide transport system permease subunit
MSADAFEILMVVALGVLAGTGIGLLFGFAARNQKSEWTAMTRKEQTLTIVSLLIFCSICTVGLGYYSLT